MRGIYYAGVMRALDEAGIIFSDIAGISVGSTAAAWHAAGQAGDVLRAWEALEPYRFSYHPFLNTGRRKNLDWLIGNVSLPQLDLQALQESGICLHVAASRILPPWNWKAGMFARDYFRFERDFDCEEALAALRASCYMPFVNGVFSALKIDQNWYLDGGLTGRIPLDCADPNMFEEIWIAVSSSRGIAELKQIDFKRHPETEFILIIPSKNIPIGRTQINAEKFQITATLGYSDTIKKIETLYS